MIYSKVLGLLLALCLTRDAVAAAVEGEEKQIQLAYRFVQNVKNENLDALPFHYATCNQASDSKLPKLPYYQYVVTWKKIPTGVPANQQADQQADQQANNDDRDRNENAERRLITSNQGSLSEDRRSLKSQTSRGSQHSGGSVGRQNNEAVCEWRYKSCFERNNRSVAFARGTVTQTDEYASDDYTTLGKVIVGSIDNDFVVTVTRNKLKDGFNLFKKPTKKKDGKIIIQITDTLVDGLPANMKPYDRGLSFIRKVDTQKPRVLSPILTFKEGEQDKEVACRVYDTQQKLAPYYDNPFSNPNEVQSSTDISLFKNMDGDYVCNLNIRNKYLYQAWRHAVKNRKKALEKLRKNDDFNSYKPISLGYQNVELKSIKIPGTEVVWDSFDLQGNIPNLKRSNSEGASGSGYHRERPNALVNSGGMQRDNSVPDLLTSGRQRSGSNVSQGSQVQDAKEQPGQVPDSYDELDFEDASDRSVNLEKAP